MSTSYYQLRMPFTSVREEWDSGSHTKLGLWVSHANCGYITVRNEEVKSVLLALAANDPAVARLGEPRGGTCLQWEVDDVDDDAVLISEFGELVTCRILKELCGEID